MLNRVTGGDVSQIFGALQATGQVFLVNPNGVYIGPGARIDVGSFMATTLDINNAEFMRGGDLHFSGNSTASVVNHGSIRAIEGNVYLVGHRVENHGNIQAGGYVGLAAAQGVKLVDGARPHLVVTATADSTGNATGGVLNAGSIEAAKAELLAAHGNVYALAINNRGTIRANGVEINEDGIFLVANGGRIVNTGHLIAKRGASGGLVKIEAAGGSVEIGGKVDVAAQLHGPANFGGAVQITADNIKLTAATLDASGHSGGGTVLVGGGWQGANPLVHNATSTVVDAATSIRADALDRGQGGTVVVWADGATRFAGNITARGGALGGDGGQVEVSGKAVLSFAGMVDTSAVAGRTGTLLLDPTNFSVNAGAGAHTASSIGTTTLVALLAGNNVTLQTAATGAEDGDIFVNGSFAWSSANDLTLSAHRHVVLAGGVSIVHSGAGNLELRADSQSTGAGTVQFLGDSAIQFTGGGNVDILYNPASYDSPTDYSSHVILSGGSTLFAGMLVNNVDDLQAISTNLDGSYALGRDIDASATAGWNGGGQSFAAGSVTGSRSVGGLVGDLIASDVEQSYATASVQGQEWVGGLVGGASSASIRESYAAGSVSGTNGVGGFIGDQRDPSHAFTDNFWDTQTSGQSSGIGSGFTSGSELTGLTTAEMQQQATYTTGGHNWDFASTWHMVNGLTYPLLQSQDLPAQPLVPIGGTVFTQWGGAPTAAADGLMLTLLQNGAVIGSTTTDINGTYNFDLDALAHGDALLVYLDNNAGGEIGATAWRSDGASTISLDVYIGALLGTASAGNTVDVALFADALGTVNDPDIPYSIGSLNVAPGIDFILPTGNTLVLDDDIITTGADIILQGAVQVGAAASLRAGNDLLIDGTFTWDTADELNLLAGRHIRLDSSVQNTAGTQAGEGGIVNMVAGWDGATGLGGSFDFAAIAADTDSYGMSGGSVYINKEDGTGTAGVAVGSRFGATNVAAYDLVIRAGNVGGIFEPPPQAYAQLGLHTDRALANFVVDSPITVLARHDVIAMGGTGYFTQAQIGHGFSTIDSVQSGHVYRGEIRVTAGGDLTFLGGTAEEPWATSAQLGHGGTNSKGTFSGNLVVDVAGNVTFDANNAHFGYAQLGHGGHRSEGNHTGDISLHAQGDISLIDGTTDQGYGQVGHGGFFAAGQYDGAIEVRAHGNLNLVQEGGSDELAIIGHGGIGATGIRQGDIDVRVQVETSILAGRIGHLTGVGLLNGVANANVTFITGTLDYTVSNATPATQTLISQDFANHMSANLIGGHVTIGSTNTNAGATGGMLADGAFSTTTDTNLSFASAADLRFARAVQQGGAGQVNLVAGWDGTTGIASPLDMVAIFADLDSFGNNGGSVLIGDGAQTANVSVGSRDGGNNLAAFGLRLRASDVAANGRAQWGYPDASASGAMNVALKDHLVVQNASDTSTALVGHGGELTPGDVYVTRALHFGNAIDMAFQAVGDVRFLASVQEGGGTQAGEGGIVNIVAGWDGQTALDDPFDFAAIAADASSYGNGARGVHINSAQGTQGVAVGSRFGATHVAAHDLLLFGSNSQSAAYAQLGYRGDASVSNFAIDSPIHVSLHGLMLTFGGSRLNTYAHIGHGGREVGGPTGPSGSFAGAITLDVLGNAALVAGQGAQSYAQIGHGGYNYEGTRDGNITISAASLNLEGGKGTGTSAYAQIGHGGSSSAGSSSGVIDITADDVWLQGGLAIANFARIGHGSHGGPADFNASLTGDIALDVQDLTLTAGTGANALAHVGHGGLTVAGTLSGSIGITARNVLVTGSPTSVTFARIGHTGEDSAKLVGFSGDISLSASGDLTLRATLSDIGDAAIGHGRSHIPGGRSGNIDIRVAGETSLVEGSAPWAIGHGLQMSLGGHYSGESNVMLITHTLDYTDTNATPATQTLLSQDFAFRMRDNLRGGHWTIGSTNTNAGPTGGMLVDGEVGGYLGDNNISFLSATDVRIRNSIYNQSPGLGDISVVAGWDGTTGVGDALDMAAIFTDPASYGNNAGDVLIENAMVGSYSGGTNVAASSLLIRSTGLDAGLGHHNNGSGAIRVELKNQLVVQNRAASRTAQIGHGSAFFPGDIYIKQPLLFNNAIDMAFQAVGDVRFLASVQEGGGTQAGEGGIVNIVAGWDGQTALDDPFDFAAIAADASSYGMSGGSVYINLEDGSGTTGVAVGSRFGTTNVAAYDLTLRGGDSGSRLYSQLGYRPDFTVDDFAIDSTVNAVVKHNVTVTGGNALRASAQIGHGFASEFFHQGHTYAGALRVAAGNEVMFQGGGASQAYAQLGHGGVGAYGAHQGDIAITAGGNTQFHGGSAYGTYAQLGNGGIGHGLGDLSGDILVDVTGDLRFAAGNTGTAHQAHAQLGHGGYATFGSNLTGDITVRATGELAFVAGRAESHAQLGHGGILNTGDVQGDIEVEAGISVNFIAHRFTRSFAQLGHGGLGHFGDIRGDIEVQAGGSLGVVANHGAHAYAQIGHGDAVNESTGLREGSIELVVGSAVFLTGDSSQQALLGHGTTTADGIVGNLTLALDQADPLADGGGFLQMNQFAAIDMGGAPNEVRIFDTRRDGPLPWQIAPGATINGVAYTPGPEFINSPHEQWGPDSASFALLAPGPYAPPFTLFFVGPALLPTPPAPIGPLFNFADALAALQKFESLSADDRYNLGYWLFSSAAAGNTASYGEGDEERDGDEITGSNSAATFQ